MSGAAATVVGGVTLPAAAQEKPGHAPNAISPDDALQRLMDGNRRYVANGTRSKDFSAGRAARAAAQYPIAALLSCADSRVVPELIFDQGPGDLFIIRGAGNFVDNDGLASLEYGVKFLGTPLIMVLGHSRCGAVTEAVKVVEEKLTLPGHLAGLVDAIKPAVFIAKKTKAKNLIDEAIADNVRYNVRKLQKAKPIIDGFVRSGKVKVIGGVYDIATDTVTLL